MFDIPAYSCEQVNRSSQVETLAFLPGVWQRLSDTYFQPGKVCSQGNKATHWEQRQGPLHQGQPQLLKSQQPAQTTDR